MPDTRPDAHPWDLTAARLSTGHAQEVTAMHRSQPVTAALTGGSVVVAAVHSRMVLAVAAVIVLLVYVGVILPAVWSTKPTRRRDARAVLQQLLRLVHEPRSP
jgi:hypothetical protein